jgi:plastocyanin
MKPARSFCQAVLDALDQTLIPGAQNAELKALLQGARPHSRPTWSGPSRSRARSEALDGLRSLSTPVPGLAVALAAVSPTLAVACARPAPRSHTVEIRGFAYSPATVEVAVGDTIVWISRDVVPHTVTKDDRGWDSGSLGAAQAWRLVVASQRSQRITAPFIPACVACSSCAETPQLSPSTTRRSQ